MPTTAFTQRMKRDCLVRGSAHRISFTRFREIHMWIGLPSALLATLAGSLATVNAGGAGNTGFSAMEIGSLVVTWTVALLASANSFLSPHQSALGHRDKATAYDVIMSDIERASAFLKDEQLTDKLKELDQKISELKVTEPILSSKMIAKMEDELEMKIYEVA